MSVSFTTPMESALRELLGPPHGGSMAFARCIPADYLEMFTEDGALAIPGWTVRGVADEVHQRPNFITGDVAVDLRERKAGSYLLLLDPQIQSAGLDGIYSSVRELTESELFNAAEHQARKVISAQVKSFAEEALRKAQSKLDRLNPISPWTRFRFYCAVATEENRVGELITLLGLWPIQIDSIPNIKDLEISTLVVNKLLLEHGPSLTPETRVASLLLPESESERGRDLVNFLRSEAGRRWNQQVMDAGAHSTLWVNSIHPGVAGEELREIRLELWRKAPKASPYAWSGLSQDPDGDLEFAIDKEHPDKCHLEIRWKAQPGTLPKGSVTYEVSVVTGQGSELATRTVPHKDSSVQKVVFRPEDFAELDEDNRWEAKVVVRPLGHSQQSEEDPRVRETEEFLIVYGSAPDAKRHSAGKRVRCFVEEAVRDLKQFEEATSGSVREERQGALNMKLSGRTYQVIRPPVVQEAEASWKQASYQPGRWIGKFRPDGSAIEPLRFVPLDPKSCPEDTWKKALDASRRIGKWAIEERQSFVGCIWKDSDLARDYANAWTSVYEQGPPELALVHTIEVQSLSGRTEGLMVLPGHPLRVAWHHAYDELAYHCRFGESLKLNDILRELTALDGSFTPTVLPGTEPGQSFRFGDSLDFFVVGMIPSSEMEPQASLAFLSRCLGIGRANLNSVVSQSTSASVAREILRYTKLHPAYTFLKMHALRPGDGLALAHALEQVVRRYARPSEQEETTENEVGFLLQLYPSSEDRSILGRFLSESAAKRRSGVGEGTGERFRWMLDTLEIEGMRLPRLQWIKHRQQIPQDAAHLSVAFDVFDSTLAAEQFPEDSHSFEAYGLIPSQVRTFEYQPSPTWLSYPAARCEGEKHPVGRVLTERLFSLHRSICHLTARQIGGRQGTWPVATTRLNADQTDLVTRLHELSDWVVTVDRNAGIEYFDSPRDNIGAYETYVIDCVPERDDLNAVQLVTSTSQVDEVLKLLNTTLDEMQLSRSQANARFLLSQLKALSGRMAMRLAVYSQRSEMVAIAMLYGNSRRSADSSDWLSVKTGFFVPLDDVRDLLTKSISDEIGGADEPAGANPNLRADFLYVGGPARGPLQMTVVEVKFRRLLKMATGAELIDQISAQTAQSRHDLLSNYFTPSLTQTQKVLRRRRLVRTLRFYLDKARRHDLEETSYKRLSDQLERMLNSGFEFVQDGLPDRGYIFCPEHEGPATRFYEDGSCDIYLFGPFGLPDLRVLPSQPGVRVQADPGSAVLLSEATPAESASVSEPRVDEITLHLGTRANGQALDWGMSIRGNPHLMIVGLPGMGKTTSVINLCSQAFKQGVTPIVFGFHPDIEEKLAKTLPDLQLVDMEQGLGFNPMRVIGTGVNAWLDNVGMLRDIFASIYSDFGDLQNNEIREAIKKSYVENGYGSAEKGAELSPPAFQRFYEMLRTKEKPNHGILSRLGELHDYGFFAGNAGDASLLESQKPTIVRLYANQNEVIQNAIASFVLLNIYQNMFVRGTQDRLTHVVVFDEAHRASRLKLVPTMAKECRKFGLSLVVASQEAKDFSPSLYAAVANYLMLRVTEMDAKALAKNVPGNDAVASFATQLKELPKFYAWFCQEGHRPARLKLASEVVAEPDPVEVG